MTKNVILIIAVLVILTINFASADSPPENSHPLNRCVKFVNLNDFSDVVLIGYYTGPTIGYQAYQIENDKCLDKGYKFNSFYIYWTDWTGKEKFSLKDLKFETKKVAGGDDGKGNQLYNVVYFPANLILLLDDIDPYGGYVDETNPLINETIEYSVAGYSDGKLVVYISKRTSEYNNGQSNKVETFEKPIINNKEPIFPIPTPEPSQNPEPNITYKEPIYPAHTPELTQNPEPLPVKQSFWNSISCFFKKLFGGSC